MKITRKSVITGVERTKELDVTEEQFRSLENGLLIQDAFPNLTLSDREFLMTGIVEEEWNDMFKEDE
jgi:hypothetical protein